MKQTERKTPKGAPSRIVEVSSRFSMRRLLNELGFENLGHLQVSTLDVIAISAVAGCARREFNV
jgi:hypothetical protein